MAMTPSELIWLKFLLASLGVQTQKMKLLYDSQAAVYIAKNLVFHKKTKHLRIDYHYTRDKILEGFLQMLHVSSKEQLADLMTKPLGEAQRSYLSSRLGLLDSPPISP